MALILLQDGQNPGKTCGAFAGRRKKTDPLWGSQQVGTDSPRILGVGWDPRRNSFKLQYQYMFVFLLKQVKKSRSSRRGRVRYPVIEADVARVYDYDPEEDDESVK